MFHHQIVHYALSYPSELYPYVQLILHDELLYDRWVQGILDWSIWGDESMLMVISMMWNIPIMVVDVVDQLNIYHMLLVNTVYQHAMHFSATSNYFIITHCKKKKFVDPKKHASTQKNALCLFQFHVPMKEK